jgi:PIN domain protein
MTHYLLDSNIFIQSSFLEYRFSFCGGFWELLRTLHDAGRVFSIRAVKQELTKKDDELAQWIKTLPDEFFRDERTKETQIRYAELMNWAASNSQFTEAAKNKFASEHADPWLVSYAATNGMKIVTHERYDPNIRKSVKIPNAAKQINVECVNLYDFLELVSENNFQMKL